MRDRDRALEGGGGGYRAADGRGGLETQWR